MVFFYFKRKNKINLLQKDSEIQVSFLSRNKVEKIIVLDPPSSFVIKKEVSLYSNELEHIKAYKFLDTNLCLRVYSCTASVDYTEFELKDKEKAYEYFNDLFQKEIISFGEDMGVIK